MKAPFVRCLSLACVLAGCSTVNVSGQGGNPPLPAGASVQLQNSSAVGVIVTVGILSAVFGQWREDLYWRDGWSGQMPGPERVPRMLEGRSIAEVDCAQPIVEWSKNLKCK